MVLFSGVIIIIFAAGKFQTIYSNGHETHSNKRTNIYFHKKKAHTLSCVMQWHNFLRGRHNKLEEQRGFVTPDTLI